MKKMIIQDPSHLERAEKEARIWSSLKGHPSIVEFIDYKIDTDPKDFPNACGIMYIICELCEGGFTLVDMLKVCNMSI